MILNRFGESSLVVLGTFYCLTRYNAVPTVALDIGNLS